MQPRTLTPKQVVNSKPAMPTETSKVEPQQEQQQPPAAEKPKISFGDGRYSSVMKELFKDSQTMLGLSEKHAERLARAFGAEMGRYNAAPKISFGRYSNKTNQITLKEASTLKGLVVTYPISMARLCLLLRDAIPFGYDHEETEVILRSEWMAWLNRNDE